MMGTISLEKDNIEFHNVDQALKIVKNAMTNEKEIWISGEDEYPSMAIWSEWGICSNHIFSVPRWYNVAFLQ
jgi:hypothetical protein